MASMTATDFDGFYQAHYGETVAMAYGFTADLAESQDIAQEAFSRAWQRWKVISRYEQPVSWVRRVATNLAHSRWRRLRTAASYMARQRIDDLPDLSPDHVDMVTALRALPVAQRKAVVLHYLVDLPVGQVAAELGVAEGTVKAWLHQGRKALAIELNDEVRRAVSPPPATELRLKSERGKRLQRRVLTVSAAFVAVLLIVTGVRLLGWAGAQTPLPPADPSSSPSPSATPNPALVKPAPAAVTACTIEKLPIPQGKGPASYLFGGDPTGRYLLGATSDTDIVIWEHGKILADLVLDGIDDSKLTDITSAGVAVGSSLSPTAELAWIWRDNEFTQLAGTHAVARAINENNVIVGSYQNRPAIWRTPTSPPEFLPLPQGAVSTGIALGISEEGVIVGIIDGTSRPSRPNRAFVWYLDGSYIELKPPAEAGEYTSFAVRSIRGDWIHGGVSTGSKHSAIRWNLRTGANQLIPELETGAVINEHGWIGGAEPGSRAALYTGKILPLPTNLPGVSEDFRLDSVDALSDDGSVAGGQIEISAGRGSDRAAVRWTCQ